MDDQGFTPAMLLDSRSPQPDVCWNFWVPCKLPRCKQAPSLAQAAVVSANKSSMVSGCWRSNRPLGREAVKALGVPDGRPDPFFLPDIELSIDSCQISSLWRKFCPFWRNRQELVTNPLVGICFERSRWFNDPLARWKPDGCFNLWGTDTLSATGQDDRALVWGLRGGVHNRGRQVGVAWGSTSASKPEALVMFRILAA